MKEWYEELGFESNPFLRETSTIGNEDIFEEAFYTLVSGNILFIEGDEGSGKTKLLKEVAKRFGRRKKIIYIDCNGHSKKIDIEGLTKGSIFSRLLNIKQDITLLLDNAEHLTSKDSEKIKYYYESNRLRSIILAGRSYKKAGISESMKHMVHKVISIKPPIDYEAVKIVREKIGERLLTDRAIKLVYKMSQKNIGLTLKNCQKILEEMAKNKCRAINDEDIKRILEQ